jgi:hypothetical protein
MIGVLIAFVLYSVVFAVAEGLYQHGTHAQVTRKITHVGGGIISAGLPFLVSLPVAVALGVFF